jgi:hypothetical protein
VEPARWFVLAFSPDGRQLRCIGTDKKNMRTVAVA